MRQSRLNTPLDNELRDRYFFIDYLRLHKYGKEKGYWKRNWNMISRDAEYDLNLKSRKGYKSHIQRAMKAILDQLYPDFEVIKPRNRFSYEIGRRNDNQNTYLDITNIEDKVKLVIASYLSDIAAIEFQPEIMQYREAINQASDITLKNRQAGLIIKLSDKYSNGYKAIQDITEIRKAQDNLIQIPNEDILKSMLLIGLKRSMKIPEGSRVRVTEGHGMTPVTGRVARVQEDQRNRYGRSLFDLELDDGRTGSYYREWIEVIYDENAPVNVAPPVPEPEPLLQAILGYLTENTSTIVNLDAETMFNLARSALSRRALRDRDTELATQYRRVALTQTILDQIINISNGNPGLGISGDVYEEEAEYCEDCDYLIDNCQCDHEVEEVA